MGAITMTLEKLQLELTNQGYQYDIYPVESVDDNQRKEAFSVAPPGQAPSDNILLGISGMQGDIEIVFWIWDDGTDRANGTYTSTVVTLTEQLNYLRDEIHDPSFSSAWTLDHLTGNRYSADDVFVEVMDLPTIQNDSPKWLQARMTLRRGQSVG